MLNTIKEIGKDYKDYVKTVCMVTILPGMLVMGYTIDGMTKVVEVVEKSIDQTKEETENVLGMYS